MNKDENEFEDKEQEQDHENLWKTHRGHTFDPLKDQPKNKALPKVLPPIPCAFPNVLLVPTIVGTHSDKEGRSYYEGTKIIPCGKIAKTYLSGRKLSVRDLETIIGITRLAIKNKNLEFQTSISKILTNLNKLYNQESKESIRKSLRCLQEARAWTFSRESRKREDWLTKDTISYVYNKSGVNDKKVFVSLPPSFSQLFDPYSKSLTSFDLQSLLSFKGHVLKLLYLFNTRHISAHKKKAEIKYKIGLDKLYKRLGFDLDRDNKRLWSKKRSQIIKTHEQLKEWFKTQGYLFTFYFDEKNKDLIHVEIKKDELKKPMD